MSSRFACAEDAAPNRETTRLVAGGRGYAVGREPGCAERDAPGRGVIPVPRISDNPGRPATPRCQCFFPVLSGPRVKRRNLPRNGMQPGRRLRAAKAAAMPGLGSRRARTSPGASSHQSVSPNSSRAAISNPTRRGILPHTHRRHRPRRAPSLSEASVAAHVKNVVQSRHVTFGDERTERRPRRGLARQLTGNVPNVLFQIHHRPTSFAP